MVMRGQPLVTKLAALAKDVVFPATIIGALVYSPPDSFRGKSQSKSSWLKIVDFFELDEKVVFTVDLRNFYYICQRFWIVAFAVRVCVLINSCFLICYIFMILVPRLLDLRLSHLLIVEKLCRKFWTFMLLWFGWRLICWNLDIEMLLK